MKKREELEVNYISLIDLLTGALGAFIVLFAVTPKNEYEAPQEETPTVQEMKKKAMKPGVRFQIGSLHFHGGTTKLYPNSVEKLAQLSEYLKMNGNIKLLIEGHTSLCGRCQNDDFNLQELSEGRAKRVYHELIKSGISPRRLKYKGYGKQRLIYKKPKDDYEGARNRRVEILVTST